MEQVEIGEHAKDMGLRLTHKVIFVLGLIFMGLSQILYLQRDFEFLNLSPVAAFLQTTFFITFTTPGNRIWGTILLFIGGGLIWKSISGPIRLPVLDLNTDPTHQPVSIIKFIQNRLIYLVITAFAYGYLLIQMSQVNLAPELLTLWVGIIIVLVWTAYSYDKKRHASSSLQINRWDVFWIVVLFIAGVLLNSYQLDNIPNSIVYDEPPFLETLKRIVEGEEGRSFFGMGVYTYPLASTYVQALPLYFVDYSFWGWRFTSVIGGMLTFIPFYLLMRDLFNRRVAILSSVALIVLPYFIAFNRMGYNNSQSIVPVVLTLWLLYIGLQRRSILYITLGGVMGGIGFYGYTAGRLGLVVGACFLGILFLIRAYSFLRRKAENMQQQRHELSRVFAFGVIFVGAGTVVALPTMVFQTAQAPEYVNLKIMENLFPHLDYARQFYTDDELFRDYPPIVLRNVTLFYRPDLYITLLIRGIILTALSFTDSTIINTHYGLGPLAGPISAFFFSIGWFITLKNFRDERYMLLILWFIIGVFLLGMLSPFPVRQTHMVAIIPMIACFTGLGLVSCIDLLKVPLQAVVEYIKTLLLKMKTGGSISSGTTGTRHEKYVPGSLSTGGVIITFVLLSAITVTNLNNYFIDMPKAYTPELEDIIVWDAMALQEPRNLVYLYTTPDWETYIPWSFPLLDTQATFQTVAVSDLMEGEFQVQSNEQYTFYYRQEDWEPVQEYIASHPELHIEPTLYRNRDEIVFSGSFTLTGSGER